MWKTCYYYYYSMLNDVMFLNNVILNDYLNIYRRNIDAYIKKKLVY